MFDNVDVGIRAEDTSEDVLVSNVTGVTVVISELFRQLITTGTSQLSS